LGWENLAGGARPLAKRGWGGCGHGGFNSRGRWVGRSEGGGGQG